MKQGFGEAKLPPKIDRRDCDSSSAELKPDSSADELAKLAWAIAHPARVQILRLLIRRDACMCGEIVNCLPLAQSTVSQHLKILKESGLIEGEVDGPKVCYCVNQSSLSRMKQMMQSL